MRYLLIIVMLCIICTGCHTVAKVAVNEFEREVGRVLEEQFEEHLKRIAVEQVMGPKGAMLGGLILSVLAGKGGHVLGKKKKEK